MTSGEVLSMKNNRAQERVTCLNKKRIYCYYERLELLTQIKTHAAWKVCYVKRWVFNSILALNKDR